MKRICLALLMLCCAPRAWAQQPVTITNVQAVDYLFDAALTFPAGSTGPVIQGRSSAAAPTPTASDNHAWPLWVSRLGEAHVIVTASADGGASVINSTSGDGGTALTNAAQAIKASSGTLQGWIVTNPNATNMWMQFYNTASGSVTVGTTNPLFTIQVPAGLSGLIIPGGIGFSTAMSWSATSTAGGNGAPAVALDAVALYK
jgi:hypothetical protein